MVSSPRTPAGISVVTPTLGRPGEVRELFADLARQSVLPREIVLVDGAAAGDDRTRHVVEELGPSPPIPCRYVRQDGGTAIQRNTGIDLAQGRYIAFIDDDIRLAEDFFESMLEIFADDDEGRIGGVTGYITNQHLDPSTSRRWRWYHRLRLFSTYEPGRYDFASGYPINRYLRPPHDGLVEIDFMGAGCAVWRREVFGQGLSPRRDQEGETLSPRGDQGGERLRFSPFFTGYGVLEDAHLALRARRQWRLLENGRARCVHLRSPGERGNARRVARLSAVNYRYVFIDLVPRRTLSQELRFWRVQFLDLARFAVAFLRRPGRETAATIVGKIEGLIRAMSLEVEKP